jgi:SAM-dependent methyltransferase
MSRVSSLADFGLGGGSLSENRLYTQYDPAAPYLVQRAAAIRGRFANLSTKILIAGCGPGALVKMLSDLGYTDVWGCDFSTELINYGRSLCITDDLLTVMSDAEVATCLTVLRATASTLLHVLWPVDPTAISQDPSLNWKTVPAGWQTAIGGGEWVIDARTSVVYGANGVPV